MTNSRDTKTTRDNEQRRAHHRVTLDSPTAMPNACAYLWNKHMLINVNCRGYAVAQFMQPEPSKYSFSPQLEAKTFIQPEHPYFTHHPGRFFYVKDEATGEIYSLPHEPCRVEASKFSFSAGLSDIQWHIEHQALMFDIKLTLTEELIAEFWSISVTNLGSEARKISLYPYFSIGYQSWMNQGAYYDPSIGAVLAKSITPYQKIEQYFEQASYKEITFLLAQDAPMNWTCNQRHFEGEGGLHNPCEINQAQLSNSVAHHEVSCATLQYRIDLEAGQCVSKSFIFGVTAHESEIEEIRQEFFDDKNNLSSKVAEYQEYVNQAQGNIRLDSIDEDFTQFVNHWLPRQVFYHGDVNRLTTDPQTRNYLQDNMAMSYIKPDVARTAFITALKQQCSSGAMPDGILLHPDAELKYINQVPHADHSVWLTICLKAYLDETNDVTILSEQLAFSSGDETETVITHIERALNYLISRRDHRGLSFIEQGDWCDPMNMVGYKGKGVSSWLSLATVYALKCWHEITTNYLPDYDVSKLSEYVEKQEEINNAVNDYCWDGSWYARGRTDDDIPFGISEDKEGRIYLNPQSWALLSGAAGRAKQYSLLNEVEKQLNTPFGVMMLAPSYTKMREDVGRLTQKFPGTAENGSIYNHAAIFYAYSLYQVGEYNKAFQILKKMLPVAEDMIVKGQLPLFIPNYYRGAYHQYPEQTGRSSHLFNTGTAAWFYRCVIEELAGLKGRKGQLVVQPKLPDSLSFLKGERIFLGARFTFEISRSNCQRIKVFQDGNLLPTNCVTEFVSKGNYHLTIQVPS